MEELFKLGLAAFRAVPTDYRPVALMGATAAAIIVGYFLYIAGPLANAYGMGIDNGKAIKELARKGDAHHQEYQQRFNNIEGNQARQGQKLDDMAGQLNVILNVMLTGQRPALKQHNRVQ